MAVNHMRRNWYLSFLAPVRIAYAADIAASQFFVLFFLIKNSSQITYAQRRPRFTCDIPASICNPAAPVIPYICVYFAPVFCPGSPFHK
jgi:hypothetical protein